MSPAKINPILAASLAEEIRTAAGFLAASDRPSRTAMRERLLALRDAASMAGIPAAHPALEKAERLVAHSREDELAEEETTEVLRHLGALHAGLSSDTGSDTASVFARIGNLADELYALTVSGQARLRHLAEVIERLAPVPAPDGAQWREAAQLLSDLNRENLRLRAMGIDLERSAGWLAAQAASLQKEPLARLAFEWRRLARDVSREASHPASLEIRTLPGGVARDRLEPLRRLVGGLIRQAIVHLRPAEQRRRERHPPVAALRIQMEAEDWRLRLRLEGFEDPTAARQALDEAHNDIRALGALCTLTQHDAACDVLLEWLEPPALCQVVRARAGRMEVLLPLEILENTPPQSPPTALPPPLPADELAGGPADTVFLLRCGNFRGVLPTCVLDPPCWARLAPAQPPDPAWAAARAVIRQRTLPVLHPWFFCRTGSDGAASLPSEKGAALDD